MGRLFGTDGIRGTANVYPLDCETALQTGRAIAAYCQNKIPDGFGRILIGKDTRLSGDMIVSALASGVCSMGVSVSLAGVLPTPGIAYLAAKMNFDAGIMISASHNPYSDNGIKIFNGNGYKLSDKDEQLLEKEIVDAGALSQKCETIDRVGIVQPLENSRTSYQDFLKTAISSDSDFSGMKLVVDCSNGAASAIAPSLFSELGATVKAIFYEPNGININDQCGSQYPGTLANVVRSESADVGLAFDGDADRLIAVDETGAVLTGDQIMAVLARDMKKKQRLSPPVVVTTVMSNIGFGITMEKMGIDHIKANVGDRCVMQKMLEANAVLGGEDSGHMILLNHHTTGDGMLAAVKLLEAVRSSGKHLSELATVMTVFPQCLINVDVQLKPEIETVHEIREVIEEVAQTLGDKGRVLVRYSGTQQKCRVMVEGPTKQETEVFCKKIAEAVKTSLG